jgi:hypothetical protein
LYWWIKRAECAASAAFNAVKSATVLSAASLPEASAGALAASARSLSTISVVASAKGTAISARTDTPEALISAKPPVTT